MSGRVKRSGREGGAKQASLERFLSLDTANKRQKTAGAEPSRDGPSAQPAHATAAQSNDVGVNSGRNGRVNVNSSPASREQIEEASRVVSHEARCSNPAISVPFSNSDDIAAYLSDDEDLPSFDLLGGSGIRNFQVCTKPYKSKP